MVKLNLYDLEILCQKMKQNRKNLRSLRKLFKSLKFKSAQQSTN
jgi:hypothetical protein